MNGTDFVIVNENYAPNILSMIFSVVGCISKVIVPIAIAGSIIVIILNLVGKKLKFNKLFLIMNPICLLLATVDILHNRSLAIEVLPGAKGYYEWKIMCCTNIPEIILITLVSCWIILFILNRKNKKQT